MKNERNRIGNSLEKEISKSTVIILFVFAVAFGDVIFKVIIEDTGTYAGWIEDIKKSNEENKTELSFP